MDGLRGQWIAGRIQARLFRILTANLNCAKDEDAKDDADKSHGNLREGGAANVIGTLGVLFFGHGIRSVPAALAARRGSVYG